jgi:hypothetical protein
VHRAHPGTTKVPDTQSKRAKNAQRQLWGLAIPL